MVVILMNVARVPIVFTEERILEAFTISFSLIH